MSDHGEAEQKVGFLRGALGELFRAIRHEGSAVLNWEQLGELRKDGNYSWDIKTD